MSKPANPPALSGDDEVEQALLAVTDDWPRVLVEADLEGLARIVAGADTVFIEADGTPYDWPAYAERVARGGIEMVEYTHRSVRRLGADAAVLTGRSVVERSGDGARHVFGVTDVFVRGTEGWRVMLGQMTPVAGGSAPLPVKSPVAFRRGYAGPVAPAEAVRGAGATPAPTDGQEVRP